MPSLTAIIGFSGSLTAFYAALALLLGRHRNTVRAAGAALFFCFSAALFLLSAFLEGLFVSQPHLIFTHLPLALLLGPLVYLFVRSAADALFRPGVVLFLHFLPAVLCFLLLSGFYALPAHAKAQMLAEPSALFRMYPRPLLQAVFIVCYGLPLLYMARAAAYSRRFFVSGQPLYFFHALGVFLLLNGFSTALMLSAIAAPGVLLLKQAAVAGFALSCITAFVALMRTPQFPELLRRDAVRYRRQQNRLANSTDAILQRLQTLMEKEKIYLSEDMRLAVLAQKLDIRPDQLSQLINDSEGINFNRFINRYRVREICRRLEEGEKASLLKIAFDCGFNTKSAFNSAFRLETGVNPTDYLNRRNAEKKRSKS